MLTRVDFDPKGFNDIIQEKGYRLLWEQWVRCPCVDPNTDHPVPDCPNCDGRSRYYYNPQTIKGIITRQTKEVQIDNVLGVLEPGEAFLTTSYNNFLTVWDRVTNLDSVVPYTEVISHDDVHGDATTYPPVGNVSIAITQTAKNSPLVFLQQNKDFTVDSSGNITWISENIPGPNQSLSIKYDFNPVWVVTQTPNWVRDTFVKFGNSVDTFTHMPVRVAIKLEFYGTGK